jgi:hypothetical protein
MTVEVAGPPAQAGIDARVTHDPALTCCIEELRQHWGATVTWAAVRHVLGADPEVDRLHAVIRTVVADLRECRTAVHEGIGAQVGDDLGRMATALEAVSGDES